MIFVIQYTAAEDAALAISSVTGYPTLSQANDAMTAVMPEGDLRFQAQDAAALNTLGAPLLLALYNFKAKTPVDELPTDADIAIWDMLVPPPKKDQPADHPIVADMKRAMKAAKPAKKKAEKKQTPLTTASDETNSAPAADDPSTGSIKGAKPGRSTKMAKAKKATKKAAKSKKPATKRVAGEVSGKTLIVKNLLTRKGGTNRIEILKATGWPAVSVPAMAKACGLKLRKESVEGTETVRAHIQYFGS